jgi:hypothetical protein
MITAEWQKQLKDLLETLFKDIHDREMRDSVKALDGDDINRGKL